MDVGKVIVVGALPAEDAEPAVLGLRSAAPEARVAALDVKCAGDEHVDRADEAGDDQKADHRVVGHHRRSRDRIRRTRRGRQHQRRRRASHCCKETMNRTKLWHGNTPFLSRPSDAPYVGVSRGECVTIAASIWWL